MTIIEGRVVCNARAAQCRCYKDAGHVEAGDPVHSCPPDLCAGQWTGDHDGDDFNIVALPFPMGEPTPWSTP